MNAASNQAVIRITALVNRFGRQVIHDGVDLEVRRGEIMGIVGGSGTGKSVLLRTIIGLNKPAAGRNAAISSADGASCFRTGPCFPR